MALDWEFIKENQKVKKKVFYFLGRFIGRKRVILFSYFLIFFSKFPPMFSPEAEYETSR